MEINHVAWYTLFLARRNSLHSKRDGGERSFRYRVRKFGKKIFYTRYACGSFSEPKRL